MTEIEDILDQLTLDLLFEPEAPTDARVRAWEAVYRDVLARVQPSDMMLRIQPNEIFFLGADGVHAHDGFTWTKIDDDKS